MLTFQLDALVLFEANEAKAWGTSIYSYFKTRLSHAPVEKTQAETHLKGKYAG